MNNGPYRDQTSYIQLLLLYSSASNSLSYLSSRIRSKSCEVSTERFQKSIAIRSVWGGVSSWKDGQRPEIRIYVWDYSYLDGANVIWAEPKVCLFLCWVGGPRLGVRRCDYITIPIDWLCGGTYFNSYCAVFLNWVYAIGLPMIF